MLVWELPFLSQGRQALEQLSKSAKARWITMYEELVVFFIKLECQQVIGHFSPSRFQRAATSIFPIFPYLERNPISSHLDSSSPNAAP